VSRLVGSEMCIRDSPSSFPQVINQADNQYSKGIGVDFGSILKKWMFIAVENPKKVVNNW
jgi:hypothetical protein